MSKQSETSKRLKKEMTASSFRDDVLLFVDKHGGRMSYTYRSASGFPKLMLVNFGPKTLPTFQMELRDRGRPEDPLERQIRERESLERAHDRHASDIQAAVKEALAKQKHELALEWGITPVGETNVARVEARAAARDPETRWSKRSFTDALAAVMLGSPFEACVQEREAANVVLLTDDDQTFKITVSMPRNK